MFDSLRDARVRGTAFEWLADQVARHGDVLPRSVLAAGFLLDGTRVPLVGPQGIFKPQVLDGAPLSITSAPAGPYDDSFGPEGLLRYRYRDTDTARRVYATAVVRLRLHQRAFRERVLQAYRRQCSFCRLRHEELLDAAHIIPDSEPTGEPLVRNGIALCALHHAAFDRYFLGLRPDYVLEVRDDILNEADGPTLVHALQALHGTRIILPRRPDLQPARELLEVRYERFRQSSTAA